MRKYQDLTEHRNFCIKQFDTIKNNTHLAEICLDRIGYNGDKGALTRSISNWRKAYNISIRGNDYPVRRLFFDIETSPCLGWFWRPSYNTTINPNQIIEYAKVICISYMWEGDTKVHNLSWTKDQCDKKMIEDFIKVMNKADEIVAHNGDRFNRS